LDFGFRFSVFGCLLSSVRCRPALAGRCPWSVVLGPLLASRLAEAGPVSMALAADKGQRTNDKSVRSHSSSSCHGWKPRGLLVRFRTKAHRAKEGSSASRPTGG
jgi:hypothetical protein